MKNFSKVILSIIFTSLIGFFISRLFGFSVIVSLYIAIALTFSSTIIIMKLLSDKKDLESAKKICKKELGDLKIDKFKDITESHRRKYKPIRKTNF